MSHKSNLQTISAADVSVGVSVNRDLASAVDELVDQIYRPDAAIAVIFVSPAYDLEQLGPILQNKFGACPVVGCSTSGEITPHGYTENAITGFTLSNREINARSFVIDSIRDMAPSAVQACADEIRGHMASRHQANPAGRSFALFLIDGMSVMEEQVVALVHQALDETPLIGGSAGDNLRFDKTWVLHDGTFRSDTAVLTIINTTLPFTTFKTQHFLPTETKLVITEANPLTRTVYEINGLPAAEEYARLVGIDVDALVPEVFSRHPIMLKIGSDYYVRSLQKKNPDGSLTFYCAIDNGLVLTVGKGTDIVENTQRILDEISSQIEHPQLLITCECVLRRLEVLQRDLTSRMDSVLKKHNAIGFHSYGEQFNAVHVNQTFTGVMLGSSDDR